MKNLEHLFPLDPAFELEGRKARFKFVKNKRSKWEQLKYLAYLDETRDNAAREDNKYVPRRRMALWQRVQGIIHFLTSQAEVRN